MLGYPGAGKTTVAQLIAEETGAVHIWSDLERHRMFAEPTHAKTESRRLYDNLNRQTDKLLSEGRSVVFDTSFNHRHDRDLLREIALKHGAETVVIWLTTPVEVARQRAVHAEVVRNGYDFSMTPEQFERIASHLETPGKDEKVIKIDGVKLDREALKELLK